MSKSNENAWAALGPRLDELMVELDRWPDDVFPLDKLHAEIAAVNDAARAAGVGDGWEGGGGPILNVALHWSGEAVKSFDAPRDSTGLATDVAGAGLLVADADGGREWWAMFMLGHYPGDLKLRTIPGNTFRTWDCHAKARLLARLRHWQRRAADAGGESPADPLSQPKAEMLVALLDANATDSDRRVTTEEAARRASGQEANDGAKRVVAELARDGFIGSKKGRGGGVWLNASGIERAEKVRTI